MDEIVYKATSSFDFVNSLFWRIICVFGMGYLAFHYEENPPVIIVAGFILLLFILFLGNDEITVYPDKVVQKTTAIWDVVFKSKGRIIEIRDIEKASMPDTSLPSAPAIGLLLILAAVLPKGRSRSYDRRFYLDLKNGKSITLFTSLGNAKIGEIVNAINSLI